MKKFLIIAACMLVSVHFAKAQGCSQFINAVNGKKMVYDNLDGKGNKQGQITYTSSKKDASTVNFHTEITDKNGKSFGTSDSEIICTGESINIDMKSFIPAQSARQFSNMEMHADGKYLVYQFDLKAGQMLPDGSADIEITNNGSHFGDIMINITNRKVETKEAVNTPAGDFDSFKITYDISVKAKVMGIGIPVNMHVTEWFSPKIGRPVKSETYTKGGKLAGTMQLNAFN